MANPQLENGYIKIANEIFRALAHIRISGEARQVYDVILYKTYGFNKKSDAISLSQFVDATGMRKPDVIRAIDKLVDMNLVSKKANDVANIYAINKDFESWKPLAKKRTLAIKRKIVRKKAKNRSQKSDTQNTVTKDITKDMGSDAHVATPAEKARWFFSVIAQDPIPEDAKEYLRGLLVKTGESREVVWNEVQKFVAYWTELSKNGKKQKWEKQETFEVDRRLVTWFGRVRDRGTMRGKEIIS